VPYRPPNQLSSSSIDLGGRVVLQTRPSAALPIEVCRNFGVAKKAAKHRLVFQPPLWVSIGELPSMPHHKKRRAEARSL